MSHDPERGCGLLLLAAVFVATGVVVVLGLAIWMGFVA